MPLFLDYINSKHPNIEFTCESECSNVLPFLDILVQSSTTGFSTSIYLKPTFSGVYSNFNSFSPSCFKFGLIMTLLFRAYSICSSYSLFHAEILKLKGILGKNGYPMFVIDNCITVFLNKLFAPKKVSVLSCAGRPILLVLPFVGVHSIHVRDRIVKLFRRVFPQCEVKVVFKCTKRLSNFFPFKDKIPHVLKSHVVYRFQCSSCTTASYVGKTVRHIATRACEHAGISELTGIVRKNPPPPIQCCLRSFSGMWREIRSSH